MADPDLHDLDAFVAIARTRNFRRAAREIRVSASSLSQRLKDLEDRLGVRLMNRTTRSVALTEAGELLLSRVAPALRDVSDALDQVRGLREAATQRYFIKPAAVSARVIASPISTARRRSVRGAVARRGCAVRGRGIGFTVSFATGVAVG
jgi:DNA-binding transcriptional LysR family regulator